MRANFERRHAFVSLAVLAALAAWPPEVPAATVNVSTSAQLGAIATAQAGDTIALAPGVYQLSARLVVTVDLTIQGDPSAPSIIDGNGDDIFQVLADNVRVENLTLRNGRRAIAWGGSGTFLISRVTITGNTAVGVATGDSSGHMTIVNSTIAGNVNPAGPQEPAIGIATACSSLTLRHVTVARNDRGWHIGFPCGGDTFIVDNTVIADNPFPGGGEDCRVRGSFTLGGSGSFDSDGTCRAAPGGSATFTTVANPGLFPLTDNGGPTMTMALAASSFLVDSGSECGEGLDQRGAIRSDGSCDAGAFERASFVSMIASTGAGIVRMRTSGGTFLRFHPVAEANMPNQAGKPAGVTFPFGFFEWSIGLPAAGGSADVEFVFPPGVPAPTEYWKVINTLWMNLCAQVPCAVNANTLTVTLFDGGIGDLDGIGNAVIRDPGGPGVGTEATFATCLLVRPDEGEEERQHIPDQAATLRRKRSQRLVVVHCPARDKCHADQHQ